MNMQKICLEVADFLEANPDKYNFMSTDVLGSWDKHRCLLGWIGKFAYHPSSIIQKVQMRIQALMYFGIVDAALLLGCSHSMFYDKIRRIVHEHEIQGDWYDDAHVAAKALRIFAREL